MTVPRASAGLLRNHISRPVRTCSASPLRNFSATRQRFDKDDLGGPGGQKPPPRNPGGPEAIQRNWIPMLGAALAGLAGYAYFSRPSKSVQQKAKDEAADMAKRGATGVSGRRGDSGPFRSE